MSILKDHALTQMHPVELEGNVFHRLCQMEKDLEEWERLDIAKKQSLGEALALIKESLQVIKSTRIEIEDDIIADCLFKDNKDRS